MIGSVQINNRSQLSLWKQKSPDQSQKVSIRGQISFEENVRR